MTIEWNWPERVYSNGRDKPFDWAIDPVKNLGWPMVDGWPRRRDKVEQLLAESRALGESSRRHIDALQRRAGLSGATGGVTEAPGNPRRARHPRTVPSGPAESVPTPDREGATVSVTCQKCGECFTIDVATAAMETDVCCPSGHLTDPRHQGKDTGGKGINRLEDCERCRQYNAKATGDWQRDPDCPVHGDQGDGERVTLMRARGGEMGWHEPSPGRTYSDEMFEVRDFIPADQHERELRAMRASRDTWKRVANEETVKVGAARAERDEQRKWADHWHDEVEIAERETSEQIAQGLERLAEETPDE